MDKIGKALEVAANIAIITLAVYLLFAVTGSWWKQKGSEHSSSLFEFVKGDKFQIAGIDWSQNDLNLLVIVSTTCRYCIESGKFYGSISTLKKSLGSFNLFVAFPQDANENQIFLRSHGIDADRVIVGGIDPSLGARTPTLILVGPDGEILDFWIGRLPPEKEDEILARLGSPI